MQYKGHSLEKLQFVTGNIAKKKKQVNYYHATDKYYVPSLLSSLFSNVESKSHLQETRKLKPNHLYKVFIKLW